MIPSHSVSTSMILKDIERLLNNVVAFELDVDRGLGVEKLDTWNRVRAEAFSSFKWNRSKIRVSLLLTSFCRSHGKGHKHVTDVNSRFQ